MKKPTNSFIVGAVALVFAVLGYQTALLVHYAATAKIIANRDHPDTVYVYAGNNSPGQLNGGDGYGGISAAWPDGNNRGNEPRRASGERHYGTAHQPYAVGERRNAAHEPYAERVRHSVPARQVENFRFNPNTASVEDLIRLGFSRKQAESIEAYRLKGGRFRRKSDFAKSYVVSDSVFHRLEPYIDIPKLDINKADSAAFDSLPGIGGYFASKMVSYRSRLHGYSYPEQMMDIYHFDSLKFAAVVDLITLSPAEPYPLWTLPADSLYHHPYIGKASRGVVFYREHNPRSKWTVEGLAAAGVLQEKDADRLKKCNIASPDAAE